MQDRLEELGRVTGLAVSLTFDASATPGERWIASVGYDAVGVGPTPDLAARLAYIDWDERGEPAVMKEA